MTYFVYQFEAVSIQEYIMDSAKLKEMVGASQLLDVLTGKILETSLAKLDIVEKNISEITDLTTLNGNEILMPRKAGGVFLAIMKAGEAAQRLANVWPLIVQQTVPGLKFSAASTTDLNLQLALNTVRNELNGQKNTPKITLPEVTPVTLRSPRTGQAVSKITTEHKQSVSIDYATSVKRKTQEQDRTKEIFEVVQKAWLGEENQNYTFPNVLDHNKESKGEKEFPFSTNEGEHTLAMVHADGNGVGQYIINFFEAIKELSDIEFLKAYSQFSQGMDNATKAAAQFAIKWLINEVKDANTDALPIRPLILSGDDVTCLIHSDYAFPFMEKLTLEFEKQSAVELDKIKPSQAREVFPPYLTMTTGMVFLRSNQPFYMGYQLAESLCGLSKDYGRKAKQKSDDIIPSTLTFVHTTSTLFEDAKDYIDMELTAKNGLKLTQSVYQFGKEDATRKTALVHFSALKELSSCFNADKLNISFIRKLATTLSLDTNQAAQQIERWQEIIKKDGDATQRGSVKDLGDLETALAKFEINNISNLVTQDNPISDLVAYNHLAKNTSAQSETTA